MDEKANCKPGGFWLEDWAKFTRTDYDVRADYWAEIDSLVQQLYAACVKHEIPLALYLQTRQSDQGCELFTSHHIPPDLGRVSAEMLLRLPCNHDGAELVRHMIAVLKANDQRLTFEERAKLDALTATRQ